MEYVNKITLAGNVGSVIEVCNHPFCNKRFSLCVIKNITNSVGFTIAIQTDWFEILCEDTENIVQKGDAVKVEGSLTSYRVATEGSKDIICYRIVADKVEKC